MSGIASAPDGGPDAPWVSVIIPTRNRRETLRQALPSILAQCLGRQGGFEVVVCDNGSADGTADMVTLMQGDHPNLRLERVATPGLHAGRHRGAEAARGRILAFADDDIVAGEGWLQSVAQAFADPGVGLVGGPVRPRFSAPPPPWMRAAWDRPTPRWNAELSLIDLGSDDCDAPPESVFGCNFAIRRHLVFDLGGFHPDGMPDELLRFRGDGETALARAVVAAGWRCRYAGGAGVEHLVPMERMTERHLYKRAFAQGIASSFSVLRADPRPPRRRTLVRMRISQAWLRVKRTTATLAPDPVRIDLLRRQGILDGRVFHVRHWLHDPLVRDWVSRTDYLGVRAATDEAPDPARQALLR